MADAARPVSPREISLRITTPAALPHALSSSLELVLPSTATIEQVKRKIASNLQDALLFATGEPWTSGVYTPEIESVNAELLGDVRGDRVMRIIFQGRFMKDDWVLGEVVREDDAVTFHMILKPSIADELIRAYEPRDRTHSSLPSPSSTSPSPDQHSTQIPPTTASTAPQFTSATAHPQVLYGATTVTTQTIPAIPSPPPPFGTNIVVYQDPRAAVPFIDPSTAVAVVTPSGALAMLLSPQAIANFLAAGIAIAPGLVADRVPGVLYANPEINEFFSSGAPATPDGGASIFAALVNSQFDTRTHPHHHHPTPAAAAAAAATNTLNNPNNTFTFRDILSLLRATLTDLRNNGARLRNTLALAWLFLRLIFFVYMFSDDMGGSRFWTLTAIAVTVFAWRLQALVGLLQRNVFQRQRQPQAANANPADSHNQNNNHNNNTENDNSNNDNNSTSTNRFQHLRELRSAPGFLGSLYRIFLRPDPTLESDDADAATLLHTPAQGGVRGFIISCLSEVERAVVIFIGTLVPAVYDTWHRHEVHLDELRLRRIREREERLAARNAAAAAAEEEERAREAEEEREEGEGTEMVTTEDDLEISEQITREVAATDTAPLILE